MLCALDDSSDFAEAFQGEDRMLSDLAAKIPSSLPPDVLPLFAELTCYVSYGCGVEKEDATDMTWEEIEAALSAWLPALLHACIRCCSADPCSAFLAMNHVLDREFSWVAGRCPGVDAVFASAAKVAGDATAAPLAKAHAVKLLSAKLAAAILSEDESLAAFVPLQELLLAQIAEASASPLSRMFTLTCLENVAVAAHAVGRKPGPGRLHLLASGFVQAIVEFARTICWDEDVAAHKASCATGMCIVAMVVPSSVSIDSCTDMGAMRVLLDGLIATQREVCNQLAALRADELLAACLVGDNSGNHLEQQNSQLLAGLLALLAFADPAVSLECSQRLAQRTTFVECVRDYHALNRIYMRSREFTASIMGMSKEATLSRLLLTCFLPSLYPSPELVAEFSKNARMRTAGGEVLSAASESPPTPMKVLTEALQTRDRRTRVHVVDDWMLALSCLESRHAQV